MKRILQCLVWITIMTASGRTQRDYSYSHNTQYPRTFIFPGTRAYETYEQQRNRPSEHLHSELQDPSRQRLQSRLSEQRTENGYRVQLSKRGALESEVSSQVVFPGPTSKSGFEPEISEECKKRGYCTRIPNYPKQEVKRLLDTIGDDIRNRFQMDELDNSDFQIAQRFGSQSEPLKLCSSIEEILIPDSLPDKDDKWWTVLQDRENNMTQGFRAETCSNRGSKCSELITYPLSYTHICQQKYVYRTVLIVNENRAIGQKSLKLPSCCFCMITATNF